jgi:hypothetical protein
MISAMSSTLQIPQPTSVSNHQLLATRKAAQSRVMASGRCLAVFRSGRVEV